MTTYQSHTSSYTRPELLRECIYNQQEDPGMTGGLSMFEKNHADLDMELIHSINKLPFDQTLTAGEKLGGWSVRKIRNDYTGNVVRITRKYFDDTTVDVGFDVNDTISELSPVTVVSGTSTAQTLGEFIEEKGTGSYSVNSFASVRLDKEADVIKEGETATKLTTNTVSPSNAYVQKTIFEAEVDANDEKQKATCRQVLKIKYYVDSTESPNVNTMHFKTKQGGDGLANGTISLDSGVQHPYVTLKKNQWDTITIDIPGDTTSIGKNLYIFLSDDNSQSNPGLTVGETIYIQDITVEYSSPSLYVDTWYDQSGSDQHMTQPTFVNQPKLAENGVIFKDSKGRPEISFLLETAHGKFMNFGGGPSTDIDTDIAGLDLGATHSIYFKANIRETGNSSRTLSTDGHFRNLIMFHANNTAKYNIVRGPSGSTTSESTTLSNLSARNNDAVFTIISDGSIVTAYQNSLNKEDDSFAVQSDFKLNQLGSSAIEPDPVANNPRASFTTSELIFLKKDTSAIRPHIEGNISAHYNTPHTPTSFSVIKGVSNTDDSAALEFKIHRNDEYRDVENGEVTFKYFCPTGHPAVGKYFKVGSYSQEFTGTPSKAIVANQWTEARVNYGTIFGGKDKTNNQKFLFVHETQGYDTDITKRGFVGPDDELIIADIIVHSVTNHGSYTKLDSTGSGYTQPNYTYNTHSQFG